jgi:hypothetical protein
MYNIFSITRTSVFVMPCFFVGGKRHAKSTSLLPYFAALVLHQQLIVSLGKSFPQYLPVCPNFLTVSRFLSSGREVSAIVKYIKGL